MFSTKRCFCASLQNPKMGPCHTCCRTRCSFAWFATQWHLICFNYLLAPLLPIADTKHWRPFFWPQLCSLNISLQNFTFLKPKRDCEDWKESPRDWRSSIFPGGDHLSNSTSGWASLWYIQSQFSWVSDIMDVFSAKYTTTLPKWSQYGSSIALVSLHSFERFQTYQMKIDWDNIYYVSVTSSRSNVSNSEQFVSICGRNSNLATITLLAPQPLTSNNRKGNQPLNCQNWNLPQTAQCKCIMQPPSCWKTKTSRDPLDCSLIAMRWTECIP